MSSQAQPPTEAVKTAQRPTVTAGIAIAVSTPGALDRPRMNLADRTDPAVIAALTHRCPMCGASPSLDCRSIINHRPLPDRVVHYCRLETT